MSDKINNLKQISAIMNQYNIKKVLFNDNGQILEIISHDIGKEIVHTSKTQEDKIQDQELIINDNMLTFCSPMIGTFYRAPAQDADPFINVGDTIKKGDNLFLIEAMKTFHTIESNINGIVKEILIENGSAVEFGEIILKIQEL